MSRLILPELGEGIEKATVACIHRRVGDQVFIDDDVIEVVTDKASFNITAEEMGVIQKVLVKEGDEVRIGAPLVVIHSSEN